MLNKVLIAAGILYFLYWRKNNKSNVDIKDEIIEDIKEITNGDIDTIRINLHEFLRELFPEMDEDDIEEDVLSITTV